MRVLLVTAIPQMRQVGSIIACISMCSFSKHSRNILGAFVDEELSNQSWNWFSRVASYSNPSDAASRLDFDIMEKRFLVLMIVDKEVAKFACVSVCSFSKHSRNILRALVDEELSNQSGTWYSRVASYSNPSDAASRLEFDRMEKRFCTRRVRVALPVSMMRSS
jgi:hypothetical protein